MQPNLQRGFRLHNRTVLPGQNRITGGGEDVHVVPRTMAVLVCLAEHAGDVVTREFLDEHVWRGSVVTDHALTSCISELRNHLGDARGESRFIETVPKRGYRLIAPVILLEGEAAPEAQPPSRSLLRTALPLGLVLVVVVIAGVWWARQTGPGVDAAGLRSAGHVSRPVVGSAGAMVTVAAPPASVAPALVDRPIPAKSVAVLPFANESGKEEQFFSDGLSEDLITALSQFEGLKVISRNSAFQFRDSKDSSAKIGKLLGVAYLLEGSVRRAGNEVRITATLVSAADGSTLWSQHYDRPYEDLFALQDAITEAVAGVLEVKLLTAPSAVVQTDRPPGGSLAAYAAYQHGLAYVALGTEASWRRAIAAFTEATRLDPHYAAAYARLGGAWNGLAGLFLGGNEAAQANAKARVAVATALKLDPDSSLAHQARAQLLLSVDFDWTDAAAEARRALQLAPNDDAAKFVLADALASLGQVQRAVELARQALDADPRHANAYLWLSNWLAGRGQLDAARQAIETAITLQPGATFYHWRLAIIEILRGDAKAALAAARQEPPGLSRDIAMAFVLQIGPDRAAADAALKTLIDTHADGAAYQIADVYALRKVPDTMFQWLDRAWSNRDPGIGFLLYDPLILRYRDDPRFAAFAKKVGLPTTTDAVPMK